LSTNLTRSKFLKAVGAGTAGLWVVTPAAYKLFVRGLDYYARNFAGANDDWIKVNLANETGMVIDGKPVHASYMETVHRASKPLPVNPATEIRVGMDFGLTPAAAFTQRALNGRWHVIDELVCYDMGATRFADELKRKCAEIRQRTTDGDLLVFVFRGDPTGDNRDPSNEETVIKVLRANGIPASGASTNNPTIRRDAVDRPLTRMVEGGPGLLLDPRCKVLHKALKGAWCYKRVKVSGGDRFKDQADKNAFSHVGEALEYALMDAGEHAVVNAPVVNRQMHRPVQMKDWSVF
jgi:hypothetical protein